jgi:hypothetical protein
MGRNRGGMKWLAPREKMITFEMSAPCDGTIGDGSGKLVSRMKVLLFGATG